MAGFVDVLLRGLLLALTSVVLGGVAWVVAVLGAGPGVKPDAASSRALGLVAGAAAMAVVTQGALVLVALSSLADGTGAWPLAAFVETTFARAALGRAGVAIVVAVTAARLARRPAGRGGWTVLIGASATLVASSAVLSHAIARVEDRALLVAIDAVHQLGTALWVGGLAHLTVYATRRDTAPDVPGVVARFSRLALVSMLVVLASGGALTVVYVGDAAAFLGTAYGVMIVSKVLLLAAALALAGANHRAVRAATATGPPLRIYRYVEVELGLGLTLLFAAASLTSLPPSVDVREDRVSLAEVAARFRPAFPRLASPPHDELVRTADPLMAPPVERKAIERAWSEYNHHWSGLFVLAMALLAVAERRGVRAARHWPVLFFGLGAFMFVRNDPRAWPLGPAGFWESLALPDVLQHRAFVLLVVLFGGFEWMVRTGRLPRRPWGYVFPLLCAVGGGLLLTHSHAMFNVKEEFLTEVAHAPLGILGAFMGWGRWLELRLPESRKVASRVWTLCFVAVGLLLLIYREG
jgi:putative copper resistance protein D